MIIHWHGQSFFEIITGPSKNNQVRIAIDPFDESLGLKIPNVEADILLISHYHHDHANKKAILGNYFLIEGAGEYEVKGIFIQGIPSFHDQFQGRERGPNTIYTIESEDLKICHLGDFGQKGLTTEQLEKIGQVDVLLIPVGGIYTISSKGALRVMSQLEPKITIPMHYALPRLKIKLEPVDKFLRTLGIKSLEPLKKLVLKKKNLSPEEAKVVLLRP